MPGKTTWVGRAEENAGVRGLPLRMEWEWTTLLRRSHMMDGKEGAFQAERIANTKALGDVLEKQRKRSVWHSMCAQ